MSRPIGTAEDRKVKLLARLHTEKAVETIIRLLDAEESSVRLAAANALLDRGYGKPRQVIEGDFKHEHTVDVGESPDLSAKLERLRPLRAGNTVQ